MTLFYIFLFIHNIIIKSTIVFPFKKNDTEFNPRKEKDLFMYLNKKIYINISIGTPSQIIPTFLNMEKTTFFFSNEENKIYNKQQSSSYKQLQPNKSFSKEFFEYGNFSSENFIFKNEKNEEIKINNFIFILINKNKYSYSKPGEMGLKLYNNIILSNSSFIFQLKDKKIIKNIIFSFIFENNNEGKFIIGKYPHEYNYKKYKKENLRLTYSGKFMDIPVWTTQFDNIYLGDKIIKHDDIHFNFKIEHSCIITTYNFFLNCSEYFFKEYLENKKCKIDRNHTGNINIYCDDDIDITKFPILKFEHKIWNFTFEFDYNDLFVKYGNKYYFLIIFDLYIYNTWTLGEIFLKKYTLVFDHDNKVIGFYYPYIKEKSILFIIFLFILIICIGVLIYIYIKFLNKRKRRIRNNEIDEVYDYLPK